jgi:hypothetical protein
VQKVEGMRKKKFKKKGTEPDRPGINLRPTGDQRSPVGHLYAWLVRPCYFFYKNLIFLKFVFWKFGRMGVQDPHFLKLTPTLKSVKCSIRHGDWRFHFFSNFIFLKFRVHMDLHIYRWDFCFPKN